MNHTNGTTANESCKDKITWLKINNLFTPLAPYKAATITAGIMAISRVIKRRNHGVRRMLRNPSMTTCPASVPVSVEFCPDASSATANTVLASDAPNTGVSNW